MKRIRIPALDVGLQQSEVEVLQTKHFQRLFSLKQLGLAYLVYPYATHMRGAHSIRCLHEADRILAAPDIQTKNISKDEQALVRMAALLHDIGHVPFSHTLEDEHAILPKHDKGERLLTSLEILKEQVSSAETKATIDAAAPILQSISTGRDPDWKSDVVGNTICADLLAYIVDDATWTGIEKRPGHYRVYEYFDIRNDRLCTRLTKGGIRTDIVSAIIDLLDMRYALTERVIFHHAKAIASGMLARAARLVSLKEDARLLHMGDEVFLTHLEERTRKAKSIPDEDRQGAQRLLNGIQSRSLHGRLYKVTVRERRAVDAADDDGAFCRKWRDPQLVEEMLSRVENVNSIPRGTLSLWCPPESSAMKLVKAQVVFESGSGMNGPCELRSEEVRNHFPGVHHRVETIENQYHDLWTFWIGLDRGYWARSGAVFRTLEDELEARCDTTFRESYLMKNDQFRESHSLSQSVETVARTLLPGAEHSLDEQAALGGEPKSERETILHAINEQINAELGSTELKVEKDSEQMSLEENGKDGISQGDG